jgi:cytosine/adenosine deaminase-related metal-dependent hydrolase
MDILIKHATVITMDERRRILDDGAVAIADGRIVAVEKTAAVAGDRAGIEIDARNMIVMPGLVNAHVHLSYSLAKGCGDDLPFTQWIQVVFKTEDTYSEEEWYLASMLSIIEMIKSGTTCFGDTNMYDEIDQVVRAVEETGIRGVLGKNITNITAEELKKNPWLERPFDPEDLSVAAAVRDYERLNGKANGRITIRFTPEIWPACSSDGYREVASVSKEKGIGRLIHHTEAREWGEFVQQEYGKPPTMMLDDFGILGPETLLENASLLSEEEISLIADTGTCFNYLPTPNMKNYLGVLDVTRLLAKGVPVSLGTSGALINNVNDLFREMRTLALQQRVVKQRPDAIAAETVLEMATVLGARCLGLDSETGSLEAGKRADVIVVNAYQPHMVPVFNPVSNIVHCASGGDVDTVIVDGRVIMMGRRMLTVNEGAVLARVVEDGARTIRRTGVPDQPHARSRWGRV